MNKPAIKLMPDYGCSPLWHDGGAEVGNIDPYDIELSDSLRSDLAAWSACYESHLDLRDPASCSWTKAEEVAFDTTGVVLWKRLVEEVGGRYSVSFYGVNEKRK